MLADIASPEKYIKTNELKEITTGNMFGRTMSSPDENGLVSYEIFGVPGSKQRKKSFAYIDLGDIFVHPMAYSALVRLKKVIIDVVAGNGLFYVKGGVIYKYTDKSKLDGKYDIGSGVHWLKKHIKEISFEKDKASPGLIERKQFIESLSMDEMFVDKWLIIPAYYRDVDPNTRKKNDINLMYQSLISQAKIVKQSVMMLGAGEVTDSHRKIQDKLNELYTYFVTFIGGTKAFMQRHVIGKAPDYSARMVISSAQITSNSPSQMSVDYAHSACPLSMVLECFDPFIQYGFKQFVRGQIGGSNYIYEKGKNGEFIRTELAPYWEQCLLKDNIQALIKLYTDSNEHRLEYFKVEAADGRMIPLGYVCESEITSTDDSVLTHDSRPITLCELFYIIAMDYCKDKAIMITRYPIEDYQNIYPSLMNIIPYSKTKVATVNGVTYPRFPDISKEDILNKNEPEIGQRFNDTLHLFPTYLKALGGDFDGDTVTVQGVFSKSKPEDYIFSPMNLVNISGGAGGTREISDVNSQILFALTRSIDD